jgi:hypothetical protein
VPDPLAHIDRAPPSRPAKPKRIPRVSARDHDVASLRRLAWRWQGVALIAVDDLEDELVRAIVTELANRMYGPRR